MLTGEDPHLGPGHAQRFRQGNPEGTGAPRHEHSFSDADVFHADLSRMAGWGPSQRASVGCWTMDWTWLSL
jgi:hypothetical protein